VLRAWSARVPFSQTLLYTSGTLVCSLAASRAERQTMRNTLRWERAIRPALTQGDPTHPPGHSARPQPPGGPHEQAASRASSTPAAAGCGTSPASPQAQGVQGGRLASCMTDRGRYGHRSRLCLTPGAWCTPAQKTCVCARRLVPSAHKIILIFRTCLIVRTKTERCHKSLHPS
jgi:hypothetical protein